MQSMTGANVLTPSNFNRCLKFYYFNCVYVCKVSLWLTNSLLKRDTNQIELDWYPMIAFSMIAFSLSWCYVSENIIDRNVYYCNPDIPWCSFMEIWIQSNTWFWMIQWSILHFQWFEFAKSTFIFFYLTWCIQYQHVILIWVETVYVWSLNVTLLVCFTHGFHYILMI